MRDSRLWLQDFTLNNFMLGRRPVTALVVEMDKSSFHFFQAFQLNLQCLSDVVRLEKTHCLWKNNVHLHQEPIAEVKRADRVDVRDFVVMAQRNPRQLSEEVRPCRVSRQHLYLLCHVTSTHTHLYYNGSTVWLSGNALVPIILRWVTGKPSWYLMIQSGQLSFLLSAGR